MNTQKLASYGNYGLHVIQYPSGRFGFVGETEAVHYFESVKHLIK